MAERELAQKKDIQDGIQQRKKPQERAADKLKSRDGMTASKGSVVAPMESHGSLLGDARLSHPANVGQRAEILGDLQRSHGNAYVQRLIRSGALQAKLTVNPPGDIYEKEADQVAEAVTKSPGAEIQRQPEEEEEELQAKAAGDQASGDLQRQEAEEEEELAAKMSVSRTPEVSDDAEARINSARGSGESLPDSARTSLEPHFGRDFSDVRVHTGSEADSLSNQLGARAFTTGQDIFFRSGDYQPGTDEGKKLLGHEMTHVVQQGGAPVSRKAVETGEKDPSTEKIEAVAELDKARARARKDMTPENMKALLNQAARCQQLGADSGGAAKVAIDEVSNDAMALLKQHTNTFDVKTSSLKVARDLLDRLALVQMMGAEGDGKTAEGVFEKVLQWAQNQLNTAVKALAAAPSEIAAIEVLEKATMVQMLGGDTTAAISAIQQWREMESA